MEGGWTETLKDKSLPSPEDKQTCPWSAFSISLSHALMSPELWSLESPFQPPILLLIWFQKANSSTALKNNL
jgi:hypothetical protein